ncbi:MAG: esterase-like activity of phytase family protein [Pseudomonadota bacterium]
MVALAFAATPALADLTGLTAEGRAVEIEATPIPIAPEALADGVTQTGAWHLTAEDAGFGGLSGMLFDGTALTAISDRGEWLTAQVSTNGGLAITGARMAPLIGGDGRPLSRRGDDFADAEGLAHHPRGVVVTFERTHRGIIYAPDGEPLSVLRNRRFQSFVFNSGLEGLASLPEGALLGLVEEREADGFPVFLFRPDQKPVEGRLPAPSRHAITGADIGPDGLLYVIFRHWSPETGISIRLRRYALSPEGLPFADSVEDLAGWAALSGIDNMEAVAVVPSEEDAGEEGVTVWILSDDNFNPPQRTVLVRLSIAP